MQNEIIELPLEEMANIKGGVWVKIIDPDGVSLYIWVDDEDPDSDWGTI